jgi:hypothetical protein
MEDAVELKRPSVSVEPTISATTLYLDGVGPVAVQAVALSRVHDALTGSRSPEPERRQQAPSLS